MEEILQTNKGKINFGYVDGSRQKVQIGKYIVPTSNFLRFASKLVGNPNSEMSLSTEGREVTAMIEYPKMFGPKKVIFGDYEMEGVEFGNLVDGLITEGSEQNQSEIDENWARREIVMKKGLEAKARELGRRKLNEYNNTISGLIELKEKNINLDFMTNDTRQRILRTHGPEGIKRMKNIQKFVKAYDIKRTIQYFFPGYLNYYNNSKSLEMEEVDEILVGNRQS